MIILVTILIVALCLAGAAAAFLLADSEGKGRRWTAAEESVSAQRPYAHVEQGPDSMPYFRGGGAADEIEVIQDEED